MKKYIKFLILGAVFVAIAVLALADSGLEIYSVERPQFNENSSEVALVAQDSEGNEYEVGFEVSPVELDNDEVITLFHDAYTILWNTMMADNESVDNICSDLVFIEKLEAYGITVEWTTDNYEIIDCYGCVNNQDSGFTSSNVTVTAELTYKSYSTSYSFELTVVPENLGEEDRLVKSIEEELVKADKDSISDEEVVLPDKVVDTSITFYKPVENPLSVIFFLFVIVICYIYYKKKVIPQNKQKEKEKQMLLDYSEVILKLNLLIGAGMTCANAFAKIATDYSKNVKSKKIKVRYAYEEILTIYYQMQNGLSEREAYTQMGKRCRIHCYIKLGTLLEQYVTKGSSGLSAMLKREVEDAFEERKALARRLGEEAGTKLLFPMIMMLGVVLVVIMVPAFMTF